MVFHLAAFALTYTIECPGEVKSRMHILEGHNLVTLADTAELILNEEVIMVFHLAAFALTSSDLER